jgi:hypothetical protein
MMRCYEGAAYFPIHDIYTGTHFMFSLFSDVNTKAHKRKNGERIFIYIIISYRTVQYAVYAYAVEYNRVVVKFSRLVLYNIGNSKTGLMFDDDIRF